MPVADAQQPNQSTAENPELKALEETRQMAQKKKDIAQLERDTIELQRQAASAGVPASGVTPLTGETTLGEKAGYLAELVAYQALRHAAKDAGEKIGGRLGAGNGQIRILIVDTLDLAAQVAVLELTRTQGEQLRATLAAQHAANEELLAAAVTEEAKDSQVEPDVAFEIAVAGSAAVALAGLGSALGSASTAVAAVGGLVGAVTSIAALFRSNYTITGRAVALRHDTAKSLVGQALHKYDTYIAGFRPDTNSALLAELGILIELRLNLARSAIELAVRAGKQEGDAGAAAKTACETAAQSSTALVTVIDEFIKGLTAAGSAGAVPMLTQALAAEQMCDARYTHYLYVHVETSGGDIVTEKNLWRTGRTTYLGGGVLNYVLVDRSGRIMASDAVTAFSELTVRNGEQPSAVRDVLLGTGGRAA